MFYIEFENWRLCATTSAPRLALGVWIPDVSSSTHLPYFILIFCGRKALLDISLVVFFILNALSRPRLESQNLLGIIYKDGIQFFLVSCSKVLRIRVGFNPYLYQTMICTFRPSFNSSGPL